MGATGEWRIVVADDEQPMLTLLQAALSVAGWQVITADDGEAALHLIQLHRPPVAILDVQMPGLTGIEVLQAVRADHALAQTRIVLVTAKAQTRDIQAGLAAGADDYLTKPFSVARLLEIVRRHALHHDEWSRITSIHRWWSA